MARKRTKVSAAGAPVTTVVMLRLYVAGQAPNSVKAIANLNAICRQYLKDGYKLEIVDAYSRILLLAKQIGSIRPLDGGEMKELLELKQKFGLDEPPQLHLAD